MIIRGGTVSTPIKPERNLVKATNLTEEEKAQARDNIGAMPDDKIKCIDGANAMPPLALMDLEPGSYVLNGTFAYSSNPENGQYPFANTLVQIDEVDDGQKSVSFQVADEIVCIFFTYDSYEFKRYCLADMGNGSGSVELDSTLSVEGEAADAKAVGDAFDFTSVPGVNLLDPSKFSLDMIFNKNTYQWSHYAAGGQVLSDYIYLPAGTTVTFLGSTSTNNYMTQSTRYIVAYDADDNGVEYVEYQSRYTVPDTAVKIRIAFGKTYLTDNGGTNMLLVGWHTNNDLPPYEPYTETKISGIKVYFQNVEGLADFAEQAQKNMYKFCDVASVCDTYSNESDKIPYLYHGTATEPNSVYEYYDKLVTDYPDYVSRTLLYTAEKADGSFSCPVYRYDFKPKPLIGGENVNLCKILYCSGTHGGEVTPIMVGIRFFTDLCQNWRSQDLLRVLRFNCHFSVIPLVNPYGFVIGNKPNENGVNLNRNFTNGWAAMADAGAGTAGTEAASENITQIIEAMIANERFDFGLDHHTYDSYKNSGKVGYFVACTERPADIAYSDMLGVWVNSKVMKDANLDDFSTAYFQLMNRTVSFQGYMYGSFPNGVCFETMTGWGDDAMEATYDSQKFNAEVLGGIFHSAFVGYHTY